MQKECENERCKKPITCENTKFCSRSCSVIVNNSKRNRKAIQKFCRVCNTRIKKPKKESRYCSNKCQHLETRQQMYQSLVEGAEISTQCRTLRMLLIDFEGNKCSVCGITEWNDQALNMELDHIDGNSANNRYENIRLICPNCHAQTPTYKGKNTGKGRAFRRMRYSEGKSY